MSDNVIHKITVNEKTAYEMRIEIIADRGSVLIDVYGQKLFLREEDISDFLALFQKVSDYYTNGGKEATLVSIAAKELVDSVEKSEAYSQAFDNAVKEYMTSVKRRVDKAVEVAKGIKE